MSYRSLRGRTYKCALRALQEAQALPPAHADRRAEVLTPREKIMRWLQYLDLDVSDQS